MKETINYEATVSKIIVLFLLNMKHFKRTKKGDMVCEACGEHAVMNIYSYDQEGGE